MAESQAVAKQALKKLEDQLTCAICLDAFKDPKLLQCFHVYCKDCLQRLVVQDRQGQLSLRCPTCRQSTLLPPATNVSDLQPAFHIHHLFEIQDALEKVKEPKKVMCGKCTKAQQQATSYCRDCGEFICAMCTTIHSHWDDFAKHEVVALEQLESKVKQLDVLKKVILYCSLHEGKKLKLYCETCEELICTHCTVKKHRDHQYDLISDTFEKHKSEMEASLKPVENQLGIANKALEQIEQRSIIVDEKRVDAKTEVKTIFRQIHQLLEAREVELTDKIDEISNQKQKNLAAQKDEVETVHTQLVSCLSFVRESLRTGSQGEVMKIKKTVMKQIKEMTGNFKPDELSPCEQADVKFMSSPNLAILCQQVGVAYEEGKVSLQKCYATGKGLEVAEMEEKSTAALYTVSEKGEAYTTPIETVKSELVSVAANKKIICSVKNIEAGVYVISYQPTSRGRHQLHIKVEGEHIKGSPFPVTVKLPVKKLGTPVRVIDGLKGPWGVAVNPRGEVIVADCNAHDVSIFSPTSEKLRSFGSYGSGPEQLNKPRGLVIDDDDNIVVADAKNSRIQKFAQTGEFMMTVDNTAITLNNPTAITLNNPTGIKVHPQNKKIYVTNIGNHTVHVLHSNLKFHSQFDSIYDLAFDSTGNVYVGDRGCKNGIQVFTAKGKYLRKFGSKGSGQGELNFPSAIAIDNDDVVYVTEQANHRVSIFKTDGTFLTSFGTRGNGPGQFDCPNGIAVDKDGFIYVSDTSNGRVQIF